MSEKKYIFVIDTDSYAGNFEREMTAYVIGEVGECGVGEKYASAFDEEVHPVDLEDISEYRIDYRGFRRPTSKYLSADGNYNSVAIFLNGMLDDETIDYMKLRARKYLNIRGHDIKITGFRMITEVLTTEGKSI